MFNRVSSNGKMIGDIQVLNKTDRDHNVYETKKVLLRCIEEMHTPKMMHFIVEINVDQLPSKIIQKIKEIYSSEFLKFEKNREKRLVSNSADVASKIRKRKEPNFELIYSIESKMLEDYQYDHIHFMFIVDFGNKRFGFHEIQTIINNTLSRLPFVKPISKVDDFRYNGFKGENGCGYLRYRDRASTILADDVKLDADNQFQEFRGHDLKSEFDDAMIRASYLCKSEQKELLSDEIKKNSFGHTRVKRATNQMHRKVA